MMTRSRLETGWRRCLDALGDESWMELVEMGSLEGGWVMVGEMVEMGFPSLTKVVIGSICIFL
jgi:hypothetical protein